MYIKNILIISSMKENLLLIFFVIIIFLLIVFIIYNNLNLKIYESFNNENENYDCNKFFEDNSFCNLNVDTGNCECNHRRRIDHRKLIGNTLLCIDVANRLTWNNLPKKLGYLEIFYNNKDLLITIDKLNKIKLKNV